MRKHRIMLQICFCVFLLTLAISAKGHIVAQGIETSSALDIIVALEKEKRAFRYVASYAGRDWGTDSAGRRTLLEDTIEKDKFFFEATVLVETRRVFT